MVHTVAHETAGDMANGGTHLPAWLKVLRGIGLVLAVLFIFQNCEGIARRLGWPANGGEIGATFGMDPGYEPGFARVTGVRSDSPMATAGVMKGDHVRFHPVWDWRRPRYAGETARMTVDHGGARREIAVVAVPHPPVVLAEQEGAIRHNLAFLVSGILGGILIWRGATRRSTLWLGLALTGFSAPAAQLMESNPAVYPVFFLLCWISSGLMWPMMTAFATGFTAENGDARPWHRWLLRIVIAVGMVYVAVFAAALGLVANIPVFGDGYMTGFVLIVAMSAYCLVVLYGGWRRSVRDAQRRYALLLVAVAVMMVGYTVGVLGLALPPGPVQEVIDWTGTLLEAVVFPVLLIYAVLRDKALDLGFVVNRTLVYGIVSALLLAAFGVAEWGIEKLVPESVFAGHGEAIKTLIDAGIALAAFLVFHRVRDAVEHFVEHLFFHGWQQKEKALKLFVAEAGFILKRDALVAASVSAIARFCDGAATGLYVRDGATYARAGAEGGGLPERFDADMAAIVSLRASRTVRELTARDGAGLSGGLMLPMVQRHEVEGFILTAAKPDGQSYRPDEIEALAAAALAIGLDLHALRIEQLDEEVAALRQEIRDLRSTGRKMPRGRQG